MPSIAIPEAFIAVTAADALGNLTVASTAGIYPGAHAWLTKDDGSLQYRVQILRVTSTTVFQVRRYPNDTEGRPDNNLYVPPGYGLSDVSAFNGVASHICVERQTVPVDPSFSIRNLP